MSAQISQITPQNFNAGQSGGLSGFKGATGLSGAAGTGSPFDLLLAMTLSLGEVGKALDGVPTPQARDISQPDLFAFNDSNAGDSFDADSAVGATADITALFASEDTPVKLPGALFASLIAKDRLSAEDVATLEELGFELPTHRSENASLASVLARSLVAVDPLNAENAELEANPQPVDDTVLEIDPSRSPLLWAAGSPIADYAATPRESLGLVISQAAQWKTPAELFEQKQKSGSAPSALFNSGKGTSAESSGQSTARVWNIQELTQHLQDTMRTRAQETQMASLAESGLEGEAADAPNAASLKNAATSGANALNKLFVGTMKAASLNAATADPVNSADADALDAPELRNDTVRPTVHQWQARPIAAGPEAGRMPDMIAQIREIGEFLAERTQGTIRLGERTVEANLRLFPPDLGGVRVEIQVTQSQSVQVRFITERADSARLIEQQISQLREALGRQGLTVDRVQVSVAPSASSSSGSETLQGQLRREADSSAREQAQQRRENSRQSNDNSHSNKQDR